MTIIRIIFFSLLLNSCENKTIVNYTNPEPETKWKFFAYDKRLFYETLQNIDTPDNKTVYLKILDSLLVDLEISYLNVIEDTMVLSLYATLSYSIDPLKYVSLFYDRAKLKLSGIKEILVKEGVVSRDDLNEIIEYYLRYKAAAFHRKTWFLISKYHVTQSFFKCFIDEKTFNDFFNPSVATEYLERDMYLNVILNTANASRIIGNIERQKTIKSEFFKNDKLFVDCLKGCIDKKYIITYNFD